MRAPFQILCLSPSPPDLVTSAYGPFVVYPAADLAHATTQLSERSHDAMLAVLASDAEVDRLVAWTSLAHATMSGAVIVVAPEPRPSVATRLVQLGVQDVIPAREAHPEMLGRVIRLAIERKDLENAARRAYGTDLSTGLPNHAQLLEHMTHLLALREREPASMALIALRHEVQAATGPTIGAEGINVLRRKAAVRLRSSLRASDVVASLGSDMFAVLLAWIDAPDDADGVARKLVQSLQQPFTVAGHDVKVTVSAGLSLYPAHGHDAHTLLRRAVGQAASGQVGRLPGIGADTAANDDSAGGG